MNDMIICSICVGSGYRTVSGVKIECPCCHGTGDVIASRELKFNAIVNDMKELMRMNSENKS